MTSSLTVRLDKKQRDKLRSKAKALGKSESELLREILDRELESRPLGERIAHLKGAFVLKEGQKKDEWLDTMRKHNWRP